MRPIWTLLLIAALIGGMAGYIQFANGVSYPAPEFSVEYAQGKIELVIERSFECVPYKFTETKALEVSLKGEVLYSTNEPVPADQEIRFVLEQGVEVGDNEVSIVANRDGADAGLGALRATVFVDDIPITEQTYTVENNFEFLSESLLFHIDDASQIEEHEH